MFCPRETKQTHFIKVNFRTTHNCEHNFLSPCVIWGSFAQLCDYVLLSAAGTVPRALVSLLIFPARDLFRPGTVYRRPYSRNISALYWLFTCRIEKQTNEIVSIYCFNDLMDSCFWKLEARAMSFGVKVQKLIKNNDVPCKMF